MPKKNEDPPEAVAARDREPTPEGQRATDINEQIALDAGQVPGPGVDVVGSGTSAADARIRELEQRLRDLGEDPGTTHTREITDNVSGGDSTQ